MSFFVLASVQATPPPTPVPGYDSRDMWLESWDGSLVIPIKLDTDVLEGVFGQRGFKGLGVAPTDVLTEGTPGAPGTRVVDVVQRERSVALPLLPTGATQADLWGRVQRIRDLTDPTRGMTPDGNFRLVCESLSGTRYLELAYRSGLEGEDEEWNGVEPFVIDAVAPLPFAQDREEQQRVFRVAQDADPFLGGLWGDIYLVSSSVTSSATPVEMFSAVPVWPTVEITGPADSVLIVGDNGLRVEVPAGVPAGSTLRIVTDPRRKSVRLDGAPAAGRLARGSRLAPFGLGTTLLDVQMPGADDGTLLTLRWRGMHRSLW